MDTRFYIFAAAIVGISTLLFLASRSPSSSPEAPPASDGARAPIAPDDVEIMAWIYPGEPGCVAAEEYRDGRRIDVLKPEYYIVAEDGSLSLLSVAAAGCNGFSPTNAADVAAHSARQFVTVASPDARNMERFFERNAEDGEAIAELIHFVETYGFEGVELDFEDFSAWTPEQYEAYKAFAARLGDALHARGKELMLVGPAISSAEEAGWFAWRYEDFLSLAVDTIVVMAYDRQFDYGAGTPVAPLPWIDDVIEWTLRAFPEPERLSIGIPAYGYRGTAGSSEDIRLLTAAEAARSVARTRATRDASSAELTWRDGTTTYFFQDAESMDRKRARVAARGIGSVSVWSLGGNAWFSPDG